MAKEPSLDAVLAKNPEVDAGELERVLAALRALGQAGIRAPHDFVLDPWRGKPIRAGRPGSHPVIRLGRSRRYGLPIP